MIEETPLELDAFCTASETIIDDGLAATRVAAFTDTDKFGALNTITLQLARKKADFFHELNLYAFLSLLTKFKSSDQSKRYNGIRVYIACYPDSSLPNTEENNIISGKEGQLTLLFVPTEELEDCDTGKDDQTQFWHINKKGELRNLKAPNSIPEENDYVTRWINHYRSTRMPALEQDGKVHIPNFQETRSLWYPLKAIEGECGLVEYIKSAIKDPLNRVEGLFVQFAAFIKKEDDPVKFPEYQLTLIFNFMQESDPRLKARLAPLDYTRTFGSNKVTIRSIPADTGVPCPPAKYCPPTGSFFASTC